MSVVVVVVVVVDVIVDLAVLMIKVREIDLILLKFLISFWENVIKLIILKDNISLKLASKDSLNTISFLFIIALIMSL